MQMSHGSGTSRSSDVDTDVQTVRLVDIAQERLAHLEAHPEFLAFFRMQANETLVVASQDQHEVTVRIGIGIEDRIPVLPALQDMVRRVFRSITPVVAQKATAVRLPGG